MPKSNPAMPHPHTDSQQERFEFIGEQLSLDFANTLGGCRGARTQELLPTYADVIAWGQQAGILSVEEAERLLQETQHDPIRAAVVLERVHLLREAIYRLVVARMQGQPSHATDLAMLNAELMLALLHRKVTANPAGYGWAWDRTSNTLDSILWPVATATADLLVAGDQPLLRECASEQCSWLFLDSTRNHSRRWCAMKGCGNQAKIRRYRQKQG